MSNEVEVRKEAGKYSVDKKISIHYTKIEAGGKVREINISNSPAAVGAWDLRLHSNFPSMWWRRS
jgi:hypothetical protein